MNLFKLIGKIYKTIKTCNTYKKLMFQLQLAEVKFAETIEKKESYTNTKKRLVYLKLLQKQEYTKKVILL